MGNSQDRDSTMLARPGQAQEDAGAGPARAHYPLVVDGPGKGRRIPLGKNPVVIGRSAPADVVLDDPRASRAHCRVCLALEEVIVIDLESSNGTYVDGQRVASGSPLPPGSRLRIGSHVFEHEWRIRKDVEDSQELDRDLEQAWRYIQSLLPAPLTEGPIRSDWVLVPCARLGGDAFGYRQLDARYFAIYLIDVSGHGTGPAMHAVSVINVLRQGALKDTDLRDPARVLASLNDMFRMETHGDLYLTVWYGVYDIEARTLTYASAGHHPSFVVGQTRAEAVPLQTPSCAIGVMPQTAYATGVATVAPGSMLYVFSDGVFEVIDKAGVDWGLEDFVPLLLHPPVAGVPESRRILDLVRELAQVPEFQDDFTLVAFAFPQRSEQRPADATWTDAISPLKKESR